MQRGRKEVVRMKQRNNKTKGILYFITAFLYWLAAFGFFVYDNKISSASHTVLGVAFINLGIVMLLFGVMELKQDKRSKDETKE